MMSSIGRTTRTLLRSASCLFNAAFAAIRRRDLHVQASGDELTFVLFSIIPWDGVWQRPQHFAVRLARHHRVIYVDPVGIQHFETGHDMPEIRQISETLHVIQPRVLPGGKTHSAISKINDRIILERIMNYLVELRFPRPVFITNSPFSDGIADSPIWRSVVYDIIDDFIATSWAPPDASKRETHLLKRANAVFTGTYSLLMKKKHLHADMDYIPCGVETEHFSRANQADTIIPDDIQSIPHPILGYFGALNERIDAGLIVRLATELPHASIVLIGPIMADFGLSDFEHRWASVINSPNQPGFRMKPMPSNIHILGIRPYQSLPSYLKAFDVCLMPYVVNDVTRDIHPVKILEYLVSGRPVVSTAIPDVERFYKGFADIAENPREFSEMVAQRMSDKGQFGASDRIVFAESKSWDEMADRMRLKICSIQNQ